MNTHTYRTDLRCGGCVTALAPLLDGDPEIASWSADVESPEKRLTVSGAISRERLADKLRTAGGYRLLDEIAASVPAEPAEPATSYYPLLLILGYLLGTTAVAELALGGFDPMRAMRHFMGGFFLVFSFFKLLDLPAFATAYRGYDLVARAMPAYGFVYPFLELGLGAAYLLNVAPGWVNVATLVLMLVGTAGVVRSLVKKQKVRCACLGAAINLPVATVTLVEDLGMAVMAAVMLVSR